jgi:hypothetical protein
VNRWLSGIGWVAVARSCSPTQQLVLKTELLAGRLDL